MGLGRGILLETARYSVGHRPHGLQFNHVIELHVGVPLHWCKIYWAPPLGTAT